MFQNKEVNVEVVKKIHTKNEFFIATSLGWVVIGM